VPHHSGCVAQPQPQPHNININNNNITNHIGVFTGIYLTKLINNS
jgi:hypothetical protein